MKYTVIILFLFTSHFMFAQQTWSEVPAPDPSDTWNVLRDIGGTSSNDVWTVGSYETTTPGVMKNLVMHWNGSTWQLYTGTDLSTSLNDLWGVTAITSNDVWAAGSQNTPGDTKAQLMHWNGSSWIHTNLPTITGGSYLDGIDAINATDIWAVGGKAGSPTRPCYALHYNGSSWTDVSVPIVGTFRNAFYDVDGINANDIWAVGHYGNSYGDFHAMVQHWNGSAWSNVALPPAVSSPIGELYHVTMIASNDVWALGSTITGDLLMIHWDGTAWSQMGTTGASGGAVAARPSDVYSVGYRISEWNGSNWAIIDSLNEVDYPTLSSTVTFSNGDIWTAGVSGADGLYTLVYRSDPGSPLAAQMDGYSLKQDGTTAVMEWNTLSEINTSHFIMERSQDLLNFIEVDQTPATGLPHSYRLADSSPFDGRNYYRLKLVDMDGNVTLFPIKHLDFDGKDSAVFSVYPNPLQDNVIHLQLPGNGDRQLVLSDDKGQRVMTWYVSDESNVQVSLPDELAVGVYMLTCHMGDVVVTKKLVIQ